jgi:hypothetical protein
MGQARNRPPRTSDCRRALAGWRGLHASTPHLSLTNSLPLSRNERTLLSPDGPGAKRSPRNSRKTRPRTSQQARSRLAVKSCAAMQISKCWSSPPALSSCSAFLHLSSKSTQPYQRGRASITGLRLKLREIMKIGRLIGVAVSRLVRLNSLRGGKLFDLLMRFFDGLVSIARIHVA